MEHPLSVSDVTQAVKQTLETQFPPMWVAGELTSFSQPSSGHRYFTLSDPHSQLRCVMWRSRSITGFRPTAGIAVLAQGQLTVYERRGEYQFNVSQLFPAGVGQQLIAYEKLKKKLSEEGLFDEGRKQSLPEYARPIGVVTSQTGAAFRDILNVLKRRFPAVRIVLRPAQVQGLDAPEDIAQGIADFNDFGKVDVLIVGRGGGSAEDLAAFNDETVVRAIADSEIPVISAVGHEIDISLSDLTADVRAPTPSAAAEIAVRDVLEVREQVGRLTLRTREAMQRLLDENKDLIETHESSYGMRRLSDLIFQNAQHVDELHRDLYALMRRLFESRLADYHRLTGKLGSLSPLSVLARGFGLVQREDGSVVSDAGILTPREHLHIRLAKGEATCRVEKIKR
ncbi:MAG: exodeoxyribonuclease VII large subunit [Gemmatimonadetes bacterium]|nr:exodeoxyribonuclease VII large subunit [Gemmatimonadota bacterium]